MTFFIYYFSGTGNAFSVAKWMEGIITQNHHKVQVINIAKVNSNQFPLPPEKAVVGFISPTHGFNLSPIMFHFIMQFPKSHRNRAFIINTRGGLKMGKIFLPGLSGLAQYFTAIILKIKGYKVIGMHPIDLPSNWISLHPGLKDKVVESIYKKRKAEVEVFTQRMLEGKKDIKALWDLVQDLLITPVGIGYYFLGRYFLAKTFIASADCDNCNLCIDQCPVHAISLIDGRPYWSYKCESCMQCMNRCPKQAIQTAHGFTIAIISLVNSTILFLVYRMIHFPDWYSHSWYGYVISIIFNSLIFLSFFMLSYRIIHFLKRYALIEKMVTYSSLTRYSFWRRYNIRRLKFWRDYKLGKKT